MSSRPCSIFGLVRLRVCQFWSKISIRGTPMHGKIWLSKKFLAGVTSITSGSRRHEMRTFLFTSSDLKTSLVTQKKYLWTFSPSLWTSRVSKALWLRARSIFWCDKKLRAQSIRSFTSQGMHLSTIRIFIGTQKSSLHGSWLNLHPCLISSSITPMIQLSSQQSQSAQSPNSSN